MLITQLRSTLTSYSAFNAREDRNPRPGTTSSTHHNTAPIFHLALAFALLVTTSLIASEGERSFSISPSEVNLSRPFAQSQLLVAATSIKSKNHSPADLTHSASYRSSDEKIVTVNQTGRLFAVANGNAKIQVTVNDETHEIPVTISGIDDQLTIDYTLYVQPIISRAGCNAGACHASQYGKGGFVLSVFGFDPAKDREAIASDRMQRRVNFIDPDRSLFLKKPTMQIAHGGGKRISIDSPDYQTLLRWISQGAPGPVKDPTVVTSLEVFPKQGVYQPEQTQQLRVVATYSDDSTRDVTHWAKYDSLDDGVVTVSEEGQIHVAGLGQTSVMVRFENFAQNVTVMAPYGNAELAGWQNQNFIDELAVSKFEQLGIEPSPLCDDSTFIRRAYLDAIGSLPTIEETEGFLQDESADKRTKLVDRLLGLTGDPALDIYNDRYAAYWTLKWSDLLRNTSNGAAADEQRMWAMHNWIKESFRVNKPFNEFVQELVTAKGSIYSSGPASFFRINSNSSDLTEATTQLFLGLRLGCAKCHHHPFEKYSQEDYYSFAAFFSRVGTKNSEEFGLFGRESVVIVKNSGEVRHPKTGKNLPPRTLDGDVVDDALDRRIPLAEWLTSKENRVFARSVANRYISYLLGRGLVEPVDDMRETNPATNPELLDQLAQHFVDSNFDIKQLMRAIMTSRVYQLSSVPTARNVNDDKYYSHYQVKRLSAEPLLDAIDQVTKVRTKFKSLPLGTRAIELPDGEYPDYFLTVFGKPRRASVCECERMPDENLAQALHTLNGEILAKKISDKSGLVSELAKAEMEERNAVRRLFLATLSREPREEELTALEAFRKEAETAQLYYEDVLWTLVNSKEFLFNH